MSYAWDCTHIRQKPGCAGKVAYTETLQAKERRTWPTQVVPTAVTLGLQAGWQWHQLLVTSTTARYQWILSDMNSLIGVRV